MLGAGFVTKPTLDILSESGIQVTVGTQEPLLASISYCVAPSGHLNHHPDEPTAPAAAALPQTPRPSASASAPVPVCLTWYQPLPPQRLT
jgi:hypothetical protein